ncbi:hypothetical protein ACFL3Q_16860 [Planctomycetota bacterium]
MKSFLKYYWNPIILTLGTIAYFLPFFVPNVAGELSGKLVAGFMLLCLSFLWAWPVALVQVILVIMSYRKGLAIWKHHAVSAVWVFLCYSVWMVLVMNGYILTA